MQKLVMLAKKYPILGVVIRCGCWLLFNNLSVWFKIKSFFRKNDIVGKKYKGLLKYKDIAKGKRCFIICTGPSLTIEDCEKLMKEDTFCMNSITKIFEKTSFRPKYYGIQDVNVYAALRSEIEKYFSGSTNVFVADRISKKYIIDQKWNVFPLEYTYSAYDRWFKNKFIAKFSGDSYSVVYDGFSITMALIQLAVYMGYKEIYILGADCSFSNPKKLHFADYGVVDTTINTAKERNLAGYRAAKKYCDSNGIKIYNVTRGGELEIFERRNLDNIL